MADLTSISGLLAMYRDAPIAVVFATLLVVLYAAHRFDPPPGRAASDTLDDPRAGTAETLVQQSGLSHILYVALWLLPFTALSLAPALLPFGVDQLFVSAAKDPAMLAEILPVGAFLLLYLGVKVPILATADAVIRDRLCRRCDLRCQAERMRITLRQAGLVIAPGFLAELGEDGAYRMLRGFTPALYEQWVRLRYLAAEIEGWASHADYRRFALAFAEERRHFLAAPNELGDALIELDEALVVAPRGPAAAATEAQVQRLAALIEQRLEDLHLFLCQGLIISFPNRQRRAMALSRIGFRLDGPAPAPAALSPAIDTVIRRETRLANASAARSGGVERPLAARAAHAVGELVERRRF